MCIARPDPVCTQRTQLGRLGSNRFYIKIKNAFIMYTDIISKNKHYHDNLFNHRKDFYY